MSENQTKTRFVLDAAAVALRKLAGYSITHPVASLIHMRDGMAYAADGYRAARIQLRAIELTPDANPYQMPNCALYGSKALRFAAKTNEYLDVRSAQTDKRSSEHGVIVEAAGSQDDTYYQLPGAEFPDTGAFVEKVSDTIDAAVLSDSESRTITFDPILMRGLMDAFCKAERASQFGLMRTNSLTMTIHGRRDAIGFSMEIAPGRIMDAALMPTAPDDTPA